MRRILSLIICVLLLGGCAAQRRGAPAIGQPVSYPDSPITAVTFHSTINNAGDLPVPEEDLEEITAWLYAFKVGDWVGENLVPGTGAVKMTITYADGTREKRSLSTVTVDGLLYRVICPNAPQCYVTLLNGN